MNMQSALPSGKITAAAVAGAIGYVFVLIFNQYLMPQNPMGAELAAGVPVTLALIAGYVTQPSAKDVAVVQEGK